MSGISSLNSGWSGYVIPMKMDAISYLDGLYIRYI